MRPLRAALPLTAILVAVALAGCVPASPKPTRTPHDSPSATSTPTATATATATGSADPTPAPTPTGSSKPVGQTCEQLVSNQAVYDFSPIYSVKSPATPTAGTPAAQAQAAGGRACEWLNTSSGEVIDLSVARYDTGTLASLQASAKRGTPVSTWGTATAWFSTSGGVGTAQAFVGDHWVVARSTVFLAASDANTFMSNAVAAVR